jgi:hypothetical protein
MPKIMGYITSSNGLDNVVACADFRRGEFETIALMGFRKETGE